MTQEELAAILADYPDLPEHLRQLFTIVGIGCIGDGRYMIHGTLEPAEVYDAETARALDGVVLVGDDFSGNCEAYDWKHGWKFGSIGSSCEFSETTGDLVDFLESWYGDSQAG